MVKVKLGSMEGLCFFAEKVQIEHSDWSGICAEECFERMSDCNQTEGLLYEPEEVLREQSVT